MPYNILNCRGWEAEAAGWVGSAPCIKARIGLVIMFFILAIIRKWGAEEWGIGFSFWFAILAGLVVYMIVVIIFGSFKFALLFGLLSGLAVGYGIGMFVGAEE